MEVEPKIMIQFSKPMSSSIERRRAAELNDEGNLIRNLHDVLNNADVAYVVRPTFERRVRRGQLRRVYRGPAEVSFQIVKCQEPVNVNMPKSAPSHEGLKCCRLGEISRQGVLDVFNVLNENLIELGV